MRANKNAATSTQSRAENTSHVKPLSPSLALPAVPVFQFSEEPEKAGLLPQQPVRTYQKKTPAGRQAEAQNIYQGKSFNKESKGSLGSAFATQPVFNKAAGADAAITPFQLKVKKGEVAQSEQSSVNQPFTVQKKRPGKEWGDERSLSFIGNKIDTEPVKYLPVTGDTVTQRSTQRKDAPVMEKSYRANEYGGTIQLYSGEATIQANGLVTALVTGKETGDMSTDMIVKVLRSQVKVPSQTEIISGLLRAFDYQIGAPAVEGWVSWAYSKLSAQFIKDMLAWATPAYSALLTAHRIFKLLPEPVQNLVVYALGRGMRKFLGSLERVLSPENAEWIIDTIFVSDAVAAIELVTEWLKGLTTQPGTFLYQKYMEYSSSSAEPVKEEQAGGTGEKVDTESEKAIQSRIDTLFTFDSQILKLQLGKPKLQKSQGGAQKEKEETSVGKKPGGIVLPFNFSVHLFDKDLQVDQMNELILPWNGGMYLKIPQAEINIGAKLSNVFEIGSIVVSNLVVTDEGLQSIGVAVKNLSFGNETVSFDSIGGEWQKEAGTNFKGSGKINAWDKTFPIQIGLGLDKDGNFKDAALTVAALGQFEIIKDVFFLDSPKFAGSVQKGGGLQLAFSGSPKINAGGVNILNIEDLTLAYNKEAGGKGNFEIGATSFTLKYGMLAFSVIEPKYDSGKKELHTKKASFSINQANEEPKKEAGFLSTHADEKEFSWLDLLKIAPAAEFSVPDLWILSESPYIKMGKPSVANISMSMLGINAMLNFKDKKGSLDGKLGYSTKIPVLSLPIPIVPGVEAFIDIDIEAAIEGLLKGEMAKPDPIEPPWHAKGEAGLSGSVSASITAGVQAGSQLVVALAAGLFAKGTGTFNSNFTIEGGLQFVKGSIKSVEDDKLRITYEVGPKITASVGIQLSAKALHVYRKVLYQREFKSWTLGEYLLKGDVTWNGDKWENTIAKSGFEGGKVAPPGDESDDKAIPDSRQLLLSVGVAIVNSAELRRALVEDVIKEYKQKDLDVYEKLDSYSKQLAQYKSTKAELSDEYLGIGSFINSTEIDLLKEKIKEVEKTVELIKTQYREILLVLVNVEKVIQGIESAELDLGKVDLNSQLEKLYSEGKKVDIAQQGTEEVGEKIKKDIIK